MLHLFDIDYKKPVGKILKETGIEQVNSVYIVNREVGLALLDL